MFTRLRLAALVAVLATCVASQDDSTSTDLSPGHDTLGIVGQRAPAWRDVTWHGAGARGHDVSEYRGKVLVLYAFQSWCPGCHSRGFPTLAALKKRYSGADDVEFVAVQTVFEGFAANSLERGLGVVDSFDLSIPVGQSGTEEKRSAFMHDYRTGGTPWTILIDKAGMVRFNDFFLDEKRGAQWIDRMRAEDPIVGAPLPDLAFDAWVRGTGSSAELEGASARIYRWWTKGCVFCETSLPKLEKLQADYRDDGVIVVGVYHPKPIVTNAAEEFGTLEDVVELRNVAEAMGFCGRIAIDADHSELLRAYLSRVDDARATSITILVDGAGVIRHVDPGPVLELDDGGEITRIEQELRKILVERSSR